jgi:hypothetical protein
MRFEVLTEVKMTALFFWVVTLCRLRQVPMFRRNTMSPSSVMTTQKIIINYVETNSMEQCTSSGANSTLS